MKDYSVLDVFMSGRKVGRLAESKDFTVAFEYDSSWIAEGFAISPFSLPLEKKVFLPKSYTTFDGLFGVFSDSLPDGWGRLLLDRMLTVKGVDPRRLNSLSRLAVVGNTGMGALEYKPEYNMGQLQGVMELDMLAEECKKIFDTSNNREKLVKSEVDKLDGIFKIGGSSGGARPKVFYEIDGEEWIVKFPSSMDIENIGLQEYEYAMCARACGIEMSEFRLLPSKLNEGYFATKRFDRDVRKKKHMVSVSGLLEVSHRIPSLDYLDLMKLTLKLTRSYSELEKLYRQMCFNVFAHNRDDHSKNFSYLFAEGKWKLSPAYDLTYSDSIGGEHATMVYGNGRNPGIQELLSVAKNIGLDEKWAKLTAKEIRECTYAHLSKYIEKK